MTISVLNDCLLLKDQPTDKLREYLSKINLLVFNPILNEEIEDGSFKVTEEAKKQTVLYILCAFSEDSPMVILKQEDIIQKTGICEYLDIPDFMREDLINLKNPIVRRAVGDYLQQFCGPEFSALMRMKIQYNDYDVAITNKEFGYEKDGVKFYDHKEHGKATSEMLRLANQIAKLEVSLKNQTKRLAGIGMLKEWREKRRKADPRGSRGGSMESSEHLR